MTVFPSRWWRSAVTRTSLLIGLTIIAAVGGQAAMPATTEQAKTVVVPISSLALSCPALPADTPGYTVAVKAALLAGRDNAKLLVQAGKGQRSGVKPGAVTTITVARAGGAVASASGAAAPYLVADASITGTSSTTRGFAAYTCQPPTTSQWLIGGSSLVGRTSVIDIANVDDTAATVDVEVWSEAGKSTARSLAGIEVAPHSVKQLSLALIDPGRTLYAVHVLATSGQVTSAIVDRGQQALTSLGIDVIAPVAMPLASTLVGVVPEGAKRALLGLLSPGTPTAARVSLITSDGTYPLAGAENLTLDADVVTRVPIPDDALTGDVVVLVQADTPVLSGVSAQLELRGGADLASADMLAPIYRTASLTVDAGVSQATALLYSEVDTRVTLVIATGADEVTKQVRLKAGVVLRAKLFGGAGKTHLVSVSPDVDGVVSGSVLLQRASVGMVATSVVPLTSIKGYVAVPPVAPDTTR